jgi:hypothetical protein
VKLSDVELEGMEREAKARGVWGRSVAKNGTPRHPDDVLRAKGRYITAENVVALIARLREAESK